MEKIESQSERSRQRNINLWSVIVPLITGAVIIGSYIIVVNYVHFKPPDERPKVKYENLTDEEYNTKILSPIPIEPIDCQKNATSTANTSLPFVDSTSKIPKKFIWKFVGDVMDQGNTPTCWAYSILAALQTQLAITTKKFTKLSEKHLRKIFPEMAQGKWKNHIEALKYMKQNQITLLTDECDRESVDGRKQCTDSVGVLDYTLLRCPTSEEIMRIISQHGPVIIVVNAEKWKNYSGTGVINDGCNACNKSEDILLVSKKCCSCCRSASLRDRPCKKQFCSHPNFNHVAVIVGYDTTAAVPHYIVLNSSGPDFGDHGYIRIGIGNNVCGIETGITYLNVYEYS